MRLVIGHSRRSELPEDIDWRAVADPSGTTIFYMGARTAGAIAGRLMTAGLSPRTPVVVASAIARPGQSLWNCTLARRASNMEKADLFEPIGVGKAFATRDSTLWRSEATLTWA